jgi:hypothetical protein
MGFAIRSQTIQRLREPLVPTGSSDRRFDRSSSLSALAPWHLASTRGSDGDRFFLPPQLDRLALCGRGNDGSNQVGEVFLCTSCAAASAWGWRGRAEMWLNINVFRNRLTLRSCIGKKNRARIWSRRSRKRHRRRIRPRNTVLSCMANLYARTPTIPPAFTAARSCAPVDFAQPLDPCAGDQVIGSF